MASLQQACPLPLHPYPKKTGNGDHKTRKNTLSGYIFILQDDYLKVTFLNCLTGPVMVKQILYVTIFCKFSQIFSCEKSVIMASSDIFLRKDA